MTTTYTYVKLPVSEAVFEEIKKKMEEAGYQSSFVDADCIDMHGIAIVKEDQSSGE